MSARHKDSSRPVLGLPTTSDKKYCNILEDLDVNWKIILKSVLRYHNKWTGLDSYGLFGEESSCYFNTLRTGDADLRFYITTVQDG